MKLRKPQWFYEAIGPGTGMSAAEYDRLRARRGKQAWTAVDEARLREIVSRIPRKADPLA